MEENALDKLGLPPRDGPLPGLPATEERIPLAKPLDAPERSGTGRQ